MLVADLPEQERLPITDAEIVDRTIALRAVSGAKSRWSPMTLADPFERPLIMRRV